MLAYRSIVSFMLAVKSIVSFMLGDKSDYQVRGVKISQPIRQYLFCKLMFLKLFSLNGNVLISIFCKYKEIHSSDN